MLRTFLHGDLFWTIDRRGASAIVRQGKSRGKLRERKLTFSDDEKGRDRYRKLVSDRLEAGFVEQVPQPPMVDATGRGLEAALVDDPDDLANHMA